MKSRLGLIICDLFGMAAVVVGWDSRGRATHPRSRRKVGWTVSSGDAAFAAGASIATAVDLAKYLGYDGEMKRVKIGEFRDRASELIRRAAGGETIVILHRDREVAKVVPIRADKDGRRLVGCLARTAEVHGDIESPIAAPDTWFRRSK